MWHKRGETLIESLFAFMIYISVIVMFLSCLQMLINQNLKIKDLYKQINEKEGAIKCIESLEDLEKWDLL